MSTDVDSNGNTEGLLFDDFVNIFENFNNLRHNYDFLDDLFKNVWHFHKFFFMGKNLDWDVDDSVDNLKDFFNMIDISHCFLELLKNNSFLDNLFDLLDSFVLVSDLNDLFVFLDDLFDSLHNDWNFNDFLNNFLDVFVDVDKLRNNLLDFVDLRNFNDFFLKSLNFVDLGNNH